MMQQSNQSSSFLPLEVFWTPATVTLEVEIDMKNSTLKCTLESPPMWVFRFLVQNRVNLWNKTKWINCHGKSLRKIKLTIIRHKVNKLPWRCRLIIPSYGGPVWNLMRQVAPVLPSFSIMYVGGFWFMLVHFSTPARPVRVNLSAGLSARIYSIFLSQQNSFSRLISRL